MGVLGTLALSWLGFLIHNAADLPIGALVGPETVGPTLVYVALAVGWRWRPHRITAGLLLAWGWLNAVGGAILSVLPLPIWPYQPEQTFYHYGFHLLYGVSQVPLLVAATRQIRTPTPPEPEV